MTESSGKPADRWAAFVQSAFRWVPLAALIGMSPGLFVGALRDPAARLQIFDNRLGAPARLELLLFAGASLLVLAVGYGILATRHRRQGSPEFLSARLARANDTWLGLLGLPIIAALATPEIEVRAAGFTMTCCFALGLVAFFAVLRSPLRRDAAPAPRATPGSDWLRRAVVLALIATYGAVASIFAIHNHHSLGTTDFDLGIYDNILYQTLHGHWFGSVYSKGGTHLSAHFEPILLLMTPPYALWPRAEFLLVLQSFWVAMTALPVFELARHVLRRPWPAVGLAAAVLLYPALHGTTFYDFHTLSLISPLVAGLIYALESGRRRLYWICFALLLITREDVPILLCMIGLYAVLGNRAPRAGLLTILLAVAYTAAAKLFVMPDSGLFMEATEESYSFAPYFLLMLPNESEGAFGLAITALTNPFFTFRHAFSVTKLLHLAQLFLPLLALPLLAPRGKVMMLYGLAFILLSNREPVFTLHFQYSAVILAVLFALTALALERVAALPWLRAPKDGRRVVTALVAGILATSLATSAKFGAFVPNESFRAGFVKPRFFMTDEARERYAWLTESIAAMNPDDSVAATSEIAPHVSNRIGTGLFPQLWGSDWILVNTKALKPWPREQLDVLRRAGAYEMVRERDGFELLRRNVTVALPQRFDPPEAKWRQRSNAGTSRREPTL